MIRIYHNPRCSKSRATLQLLQEHGYQPEVINYLDTPPSVQDIEIILGLLDMQPRDLMRRQEDEYQQLGLNNETLGRPELLRAMHEHPRLIERPIVLCNGRARIGRPPEKVLEILPQP